MPSFVSSNRLGTPAQSGRFSLREPIPAFLISYNRGAMLERAIAGLRKMAVSTEIVIHDNGSTDPNTLHILARLERSGITIARRDPIEEPNQLNRVNDTVQEFFIRRPPSSYIVSDCDIDIGIANPQALCVYAELLTLFPDVECAGPVLRIRDVPSNYPLFNRLMNRHIEQFWKRRPFWVETRHGRIAYIDAPIDTTFALHRAGQPFRRLKNGLRVYEPYEALHLDWYTPSTCSTEYARTSNGNISHWDNVAERRRHETVKLEYTHYWAVRIGDRGAEEYEISLTEQSKGQ